MKHFILFAWLVTIPISLFSKGEISDYDRYEGLWYNSIYHITLEIRQYHKDEIKIRKARSDEWERFVSCGYREFVCHQKLIRFESNHSFVYEDQRHGKYLRFTRLREGGYYSGGPTCGTGYGYDGDYNHEQDYGYYDSYGSYGDDHDSYNLYPHWTASEARKRIKGKWKSHSPYAKLRIKTKSGHRIEVKDEHGRKYYYYQDSRRPNEFYNDRGSRYILLSKHSLEWRSSDGRRKIQLYKD